MNCENERHEETEKIKPLETRGDAEDLHEEAEIIYPSAYHYVKDKFCHYLVCKHDGECKTCEYGKLRAYAARDIDEIHMLRERIRDMAAQSRNAEEENDGGVVVRLKNFCEAWRAFRILEMWNPANEELIPWRDDMTNRLAKQLEKAEERLYKQHEIVEAVKKDVETPPSRAEKLFEILTACEKLIKALESKHAKCGDVEKNLFGNKEKCVGCEDEFLCRQLKELIESFSGKDKKEV